MSGSQRKDRKRQYWRQDKLPPPQKSGPQAFSEYARNNPYGSSMIREELNQRFLGRLADLAEKQIAATGEVAVAVNKLDSSSDRLEVLTIKLNRLTWVLIVLTALAVVVPVGVEFWHAGREMPPAIVVQFPQSTAPQTPPLPAPQSRQ